MMPRAPGPHRRAVRMAQALPGSGPRGKPLVALSGLLFTWIALRALVWDMALFRPLEEPGVPLAASRSVEAFRAERRSLGEGPARAKAPPRWAGRAMPVRPPSPVIPADRSLVARLPGPVPRLPVLPPPVSRGLPVRAMAGHHLLWLAALADLPLPQALVGGPAPRPAGRADGAPPAASPRERRWSADGWLLLRHGGAPALAGAALPAYGASQAGVVARYRLAPASALRPAAYLRATSALAEGHGREKALAAGIALRPLAGVPVAAMAEARVVDSAAGLKVRPAAMLVSEVPPLDLGRGLRGEVYAQAGYVGGPDATAFVDGQARIDARVVAIGGTELRAGAGAWGGAQQGAARLDVGPAASLGLALGDRGSARLGLDWRLRVAGNAAPASGPALTLSAGF